MMNLEEVLKDITIIKNSNYTGIEEFLEKYKLETPEAIIDFQLSVGNYVNKYVKRRVSIRFLELYPYSREDLKKARYLNPTLVVMNKLRVIEKYKEDNSQTTETADNRRNPISYEDVKFFMENDGKLSDIEIAKQLKRTLGNVQYLRKSCKNALRKKGN